MSGPPPGADSPLVGHLRAAVAAVGIEEQHLVVGLSGGLDSVVLLHGLRMLRASAGFRLSALHVHHGLSPHADGWSAFCERLCAGWEVPLVVERIPVDRGDSRGVEAAARAGRYRCYRAVAADVIVLAHHADDQAETLLLQLLRGAGPGGLAAMPAERRLESGQRLWRPLLVLPRAVLRAHALSAGLSWIEDESNADLDYPRNFLRVEVLPRLEAKFPSYRRTLARAAANAADAEALTQRLADIDLAACLDGDALRVVSLLALDPLRQANAVRHWLRAAGVRAPSREALSVFLNQVSRAPSSQRPVLDVGDVRLASERGRIRLTDRADLAPNWEIRWRGEARVRLPDGRVLRFDAVKGQGLRAAALSETQVVVAPRRGGERLRLARGRPTRTLKNLFQEHDVPPSVRSRLPLVFIDGRLALVPGIGTDPDFAAGEGEDGLLPRIEGSDGASPSPVSEQSD